MYGADDERLAFSLFASLSFAVEHSSLSFGSISRSFGVSMVEVEEVMKEEMLDANALHL